MAESEEHATAALAFFLKSGNPLLAIMAISYWPLDQPLPPELRYKLADWASSISALTSKVATGDMTPKDALGRIPKAMGLVGERGRAHGAFAQVRERAIADRLQQSIDSMLADPATRGMKMEHMEDVAGSKEGLSGSQARKLMRKYADPDKPRVDHVSIRANVAKSTSISLILGLKSSVGNTGGRVRVSAHVSSPRNRNAGR